MSTAYSTAFNFNVREELLLLLTLMPLHNILLQVRARNEFTAGDWSEPLVENITVPTPTPVTTGGKKRSCGAASIHEPNHDDMLLVIIHSWFNTS